MNKRGFTLVELIIAMAILGILASLVFFGIGLATKKAHDARHKSDLAAIAKSLAQYAVGNNDLYPLSNCNGTVELLDTDSCASIELVAGDYIKRVPYNKYESTTEKNYQYYTYFNQASYMLGVKLESTGKIYTVYPNKTDEAEDSTAPTWSSELISLVKNSNEKVTIYWSAAQDDTYDKPVSYIVYYRKSGEANWTEKTRSSHTYAEVDGLDGSSTYEFKVSAVDLSGNFTAMAVDKTASIDYSYTGSAPTWTSNECTKTSKTNAIDLDCSATSDNPANFVFIYYNGTNTTKTASRLIAGSSNSAKTTFESGSNYNVSVRAIGTNGAFTDNSQSTAVSVPLTITEPVAEDTTDPVFGSSPVASIAAGLTTDWVFKVTWPAATDESGIKGYNLVAKDYLNNTIINQSSIATNSYDTTLVEGQTIFKTRRGEPRITITITAIDNSSNQNQTSVSYNPYSTDLHPAGDSNRDGTVIEASDWTYFSTTLSCFFKTGIVPGHNCFPIDFNQTGSINIQDYNIFKTYLMPGEASPP